MCSAASVYPVLLKALLPAYDDRAMGVMQNIVRHWSENGAANSSQASSTWKMYNNLCEKKRKVKYEADSVKMTDTFMITGM